MKSAQGFANQFFIRSLLYEQTSNVIRSFDALGIAVDVTISVLRVDDSCTAVFLDRDALVAVSHDHEGAGAVVYLWVDIFACDDAEFAVFMCGLLLFGWEETL